MAPIYKVFTLNKLSISYKHWPMKYLILTTNMSLESIKFYKNDQKLNDYNQKDVSSSLNSKEYIN